MSKTKEFIKSWVLPPKVFQYFKRITKPSSSRQGLPLELPRESGRCFILASGPSIKNQDLKKLKGEKVIAVSHVHLHPEISHIAPKYHVLAPFHAPFQFSDAEKYFRDFEEKYNPDQVRIFLGHRPYRYSFKNFLENNSRYQKFNFSYIDYSNSDQRD
jgi:hypothetical protein